MIVNDAYQNSYRARTYQIYLMITHLPPLSMILAEQVTFEMLIISRSHGFMFLVSAKQAPEIEQESGTLMQIPGTGDIVLAVAELNNILYILYTWPIYNCLISQFNLSCV